MIETKNFPSTAKTWVYQSPRPFSATENQVIQTELESFVSSWQAHGADLTASFEVIDNQFIALIVDESNQQATGCSIDKSVNSIKKIEQALAINLTDKSKIAYLSGNQINTVDFREVKNLVASGEFTPQTIIYNLSITHFGQLKTAFKVEAQNSWLAKYF
jgi:hypothetical protein